MKQTVLAELRGKAAGIVRKYKLAILIFLVGILLALLPVKKSTAQTDSTAQQTAASFDLAGTQAQLTQLLSGIDGVGRVQLLLTVQSGEKTIYQQDSRTVTSAGSTTTEQETVLRASGSSDKQPLVEVVYHPQYQGALVVCDGAERASVRLAVIQAVSSLTGLGSNKIAVVKMKGQ